MLALVVFSIFQKDKIYDKRRGSYYISDVDAEFKYKLELKGRLPKDDNESVIIVYANDDKLNFEDVVWMSFSSESEERTDIYIDFKG